MSVTFNPRALLLTALFFVAFGLALALAADARNGLAAAGVTSILAYLAIDVCMTFNPAGWWRERRNGDNRP